MDVWEQIVSRDALVIADAIERGMVRHFLAQTFPNQPAAVNFELGRDRKQTPTEAAELAGKIKAAGYTVDQAELEEATGFTLIKDETPATSMMPFAAVSSRPPYLPDSSAVLPPLAEPDNPRSSQRRASSITSVPSCLAFSVFVAPTLAPAMR